MKISVVHEQHFKINQTPSDVIIQKESEHVPAIGDIIKVGHNLSGFSAYEVRRRMFRSATSQAKNDPDFHEVFVVVGDA